MREILIVDGYNIIGAWPELLALKSESLELARQRLIEILTEFQRFTGMQVILVFDAHHSPGVQREYQAGGVQVFFSKEGETADELIERIVYDMEKLASHIYVATSDQAEQQVTFGQGALRITARELASRVRQARKSIRQALRQLEPKRIPLGDHLEKGVAEIFEKWRREDAD